MNIIIVAKAYIKKIIGKENFDFIDHAKNYMSAEFFAKALSFISIPIFTRLLTPEEYGILAVFTSIISISTILLGLNFHGSVNRYYHEKNKKFDEFISSNVLFLFTFNIFLFFLLHLFKDSIARFIDIEVGLFIVAIIISIFNIPLNIYLSYLQTSKKSQKYSYVAIIKSIALLIVSIIWVYSFSNGRYWGKVYAYLLVNGILFIIIVYYFVKFCKPQFKFKYVKYSLAYGIPLIPHALSGFILAYFDRIAINQLTSATYTGLYSFAYNIGMIMNVVVMAMNKSWVPIFYDHLKNNNYVKINNLANNYSNYIYLAAISLILFAREIVIIMADKSYYKALEIVPIIILSYVFVFLYTLYGNYAFYKKRTGLISVATLIAGLINIGLNYWLIPIYGYIAAAFTTFLSYLLLFTFHYINAKFAFKEEVIKLKEVLPNFLVVLFITLIYALLLNFVKNHYILLSLKILIFIIVIKYIFLRKKQDNLI